MEASLSGISNWSFLMWSAAAAEKSQSLAVSQLHPVPLKINNGLFCLSPKVKPTPNKHLRPSPSPSPSAAPSPLKMLPSHMFLPCVRRWTQKAGKETSNQTLRKLFSLSPVFAAESSVSLQHCTPLIARQPNSPLRLLTHTVRLHSGATSSTSCCPPKV